jgi:hypothetical protein
MKEAFRIGHSEERTDLGTTSGLAKNCYIPRIASEMGDVVFHPLQSQNQIELSNISRVWIIRV